MSLACCTHKLVLSLRARHVYLVFAAVMLRQKSVEQLCLRLICQARGKLPPAHLATYATCL